MSSLIIKDIKYHIIKSQINPRPSKAMASDALRNGLDALPNICTLKGEFTP